MAIVPFRYDRKNVKATFEFSRAFNQVSRAMMLYVPNMVSAFEGFRKSFRDAKAYAEENFKSYSDPCITLGLNAQPSSFLLFCVLFEGFVDLLQ